MERAATILLMLDVPEPDYEATLHELRQLEARIVAIIGLQQAGY